MDIIKKGVKTEKENQVIENQEELEELTSVSDTDNAEKGKVYPMTNIKVERGFYTMFELKRKYDKKDKRIILDADFQRADVWGTRQKCELIESVLMGLPLPIFYFNQNKMGQLIVVDGRQRLTALFEYMNDKFALSKLNILSELDGKKFDDLTPIQQSMIEDYQIQAHVILPPTPERIKFDIFDRVNRAGTKLNKQEIRNALYQGKATELLKRLAASEEFRNATGGAFKNEKRMKDKYLLLRFWAFYLLLSNSLKDEKNEIFEYKNDIDELLARTMETINDMSDRELAKLEIITKEALKKSYFYLGKDAFRLCKEDGKRTPINMNIFETIMYMMVYLPGEDKTIVSRVAKGVEELLLNNVYRDAIGNHRENINKIRTRFNMVSALGKEFMV